ncbi:MAG: PAS domain S-box protein [Elusimicrobiales bacterium]
MRLPFIPHISFLKDLWPERLRNQLILGVALVHLVLMTIFILDLTGRQRKFLLDQSLEHVKTFAETLASNSTSWMLANDVAGLAELVVKTHHYHTVRDMMIVDTEGKVLAHTDPSLTGKYLKDKLSRSFLNAEPATQVLRADSRDLDIAAPILTRAGRCLGWARVIHDREYVEESLRRVSLYGLVYTILAILAGSLLAFLIGTRLSRGLDRLIVFAGNIKAGQNARLSPQTGYEVGRLGTAFNQMLDAIETRGKDNAELRHILDNMAEGCMVIGFDWTYHYVNAAAARQRFRSREDLLGHKLLEILPGQEGNRIFTAYRRCMEERVRLHFESEHTFKEGHPCWYELSIDPVPDGIFILSLDITERKQAERELAESEKKYRSLVETLNEGIWVIDKDALTTYVNPRMAEMLGYTTDEMTGKPLFVFMDEEGKRIAAYNIERRKSGIKEQHDFEFLRKDGSRMYAYIAASPTTDASGNYSGALAAVSDMTERRKLQSELLDKSRVLEAFFNDTITPFAILDRRFDFVRVNGAYAKAGGRDPSEFPGHNHFEFYPSDAITIFEEVVSTKKAYQAHARPFEYKDRPELGVTYWDWVLFPLLDSRDEVEFLVFSLKDVTQKQIAEDKLKELNMDLEHRVAARTEELSKANERLQELDRLKSMFIATMSHELRTPLNSIIGFSSIMMKEWCGPVNDEQKENLSTVLSAGKHLLMLINDVIDVSKIEAGKMESMVEDFDLADLVGEALALVKSERGGNGLSFTAKTGRHTLHTDRRRVLQCLINLLSNAAKFTPAGSVCVSAKVLRRPDGDLAEITVTDTGIGIKEEDLHRLFSPFTRLSSPLRDKTRGTGLGLHLVKKIVAEILKGEVFVSSVHGRGSSFGFRIPVRIEQENQL